MSEVTAQSPPPAPHKTLIVLDPFYKEHDTGPGHPEAVERYEAVVFGLRESGLLLKTDILTPRDALEDDLLPGEQFHGAWRGAGGDQSHAKSVTRLPARWIGNFPRRLPSSPCRACSARAACAQPEPKNHTDPTVLDILEASEFIAE